MTVTAAELAEGQEVRVYDRSARAKPDAILHGKITRVGRTLVTIEFWNPELPQHPETAAFRMDTQFVNNQFGGLRFRTMDQVALYVRWQAADLILRGHGIFGARLSDEQVIAMAAALDPDAVVIRAPQLTPELRESLSCAVDRNRKGTLGRPHMEWLEAYDEASGGWPVRTVYVEGLLA